jgi:hypothetical protein
VRDAAFVITMLTDTAAVLAVMGQAAESIPHGAVWLQTSMDMDLARVAALAQGHGITFVNCPVIGSRETAEHGRLVVLASGPGDALGAGTADLRRDRVKDRQARPRGRAGEPDQARRERLGRGARRKPPRPAEPRSSRRSSWR